MTLMWARLQLPGAYPSHFGASGPCKCVTRVPSRRLQALVRRVAVAENTRIELYARQLQAIRNQPQRWFKIDPSIISASIDESTPAMLVSGET